MTSKETKTSRVNLNTSLHAHWKSDKSGQVERLSQVIRTQVPTVSAFAGELTQPLLSAIRRFDGVVGCVAWLTHYGILDELAKKKFVTILVQKEDFLRPDSKTSADQANVFRKTLHDKYQVLNKLGLGSFCDSGLEFAYLELPCLDRSLWDPSLMGQSDWDAVRCVGMCSKDPKASKLTRPNMHHKFMVFLRQEKRWIISTAHDGGFYHAYHTVENAWPFWRHPTFFVSESEAKQEITRRMIETQVQWTKDRESLKTADPLLQKYLQSADVKEAWNLVSKISRFDVPEEDWRKSLGMCEYLVRSVPKPKEISTFVPAAVWTGSFNMSLNGEHSRENAVLIEDETLAKFYFREWNMLLPISECCDWTSEYSEPEYSMGYS